MRPARSIFSDTLIIAVLSGIAYLAVYEFQKGYFRHFWIPESLAEIYPTYLVAGAAALLVAAACVSAFISIFAQWTLVTLSKWSWLGVWILSMLIVYDANVWLTIEPKTTGYAVIVSIVVLGFGIYIIYDLIIGYRRYKSRRFAAAYSFNIPLKRAIDRYGWAAILALAVLVGSASYLVGLWEARESVSFLVTIEQHPRIVLVQYGTTAIAAQLEDDGRTYDPSFSVFNMDKDSPRLREEAILSLTCNCPLLTTPALR